MFLHILWETMKINEQHRNQYLKTMQINKVSSNVDIFQFSAVFAEKQKHLLEIICVYLYGLMAIEKK